ncbi:helix-turn-helix domain-containing protein [Streptomyces sp. CCM_MD2014]|uniref:helix-turn-helix domain-containing protein n=1 Tax=Streptomyces sp. CCM_MD2014 TaxID=1561022 RepID=UPI0007763EEF|nr:helix-turn-helix domain-containing protein [Streptomyces sp. CCM_MD2014]
MADLEDDGGEEVQRVFDALKALKAMEDPQARAHAISEFLREQPGELQELKALRRDYVLARRAEKATRKTIAEEIGVSPSTVQDIELGYSGSGRTRGPIGKGKQRGTTDDGGPSGGKA